MNKTGVAGLAVAVAVVFAVSGCSTVPKRYKEEMSGIKTKVDTLESRVDTVESKQAEVEKMTSEQIQALEQMKAQKGPSTNISVLSRSGSSKQRTKDVQTALRNAGFYDGKIDGIKGAQTKNAITSFQKANGLKADGVVGPRTWDLLSSHLSDSSAAAQATSGGESESIK